MKSFIDWTRQQINQPWFPVLLSASAFIDIWLVVIPTDAFVIAATVSQPKFWLRFAGAFVFGSTLGGASLSWATQNFGFEILEFFFAGLKTSAGWLWAEQRMDSYGLLSVFVIAATPLSQQPLLILASMAHHSVWAVTLSFMAGRSLKYLVLGMICSRSPELIQSTRVKRLFQGYEK